MRPVHERETETQRDAARQTETQRDAARRSETQRDTERHRETQRERHTETHRETGWVETCVYTVNDVMEWVAPTTHSAC